MGCGAGAMTADEYFHIRLICDPEIAKGSIGYRNFRDAMTALIGLNRLHNWDDGGPGGNAEIVTVTMSGPINTEEEAKNFNRAFNRILWGVRFVPGEAGPASSGESVKLQGQKRSASQTPPDNDNEWDGPDWEDEGI